MNLGLGWTSIHQEPGVKHSPLGPALVCEGIKDGEIAKFGLHYVWKTAREQDNKQVRQGCEWDADYGTGLVMGYEWEGFTG